MSRDWNGFKIALTAILLGAAFPAPAQIAAGSTKFIPTFLVYYGGGSALVAADAPKLAKFDLIDIDRFRYDNIGPNTWTAIKSINPGVQIYLYEVGPETPNHLDTTPAFYLNGLGRYDVSRGHFMGSLNGNHPELYLLDSAGKRVYSTAYSNVGANRYWHLMDFGAAAYQSYWLTAVKADIVDQPWVADGVFVEDCMAHASAGGFSGTPSMYPSNAAWSGAMNSFVEAIAGGLRGYGQKLWCNRGKSGTADGSSAWLALDGGANPPEVLLEEGAFAVKSGASSVKFHQESTWKRQIDTIGAIRNSRVAILSQANLEEGQAGTDSLGNPVTYGQALWYSLGSFLLSKNDDLGNAYFMFSGASGYDRIRWHAEYDSIDLGKAVGAYRVTSIDKVNIYWREFERGYVYVNPTRNGVAVVNLPQPSRQLTRDNMTSAPDSIPGVSVISLNGHHAAILLKAGTGPVSDTTAPSVPTGLADSAVSSSQINLSWNPSTDNVGVTGYYVYLNNVALAATSATSFQHTGLTAGTTYNYRVSAFDAVPNHSAWTAAPVAVTTPPLSDTQAPSVPTGLAGSAVSSSQINLSWNPSTDNVRVTGYYVYLNNVALAATSATSFQHTGLAAGATYNYRVSAFDAVPNHSAWTAAPVAVTTPSLSDTQAPSVPSGLVGTAVSSSQINLSWNASTDNVGVTGYVVYLDNIRLADTTATSFAHTGLTAGTTYNYRVSAFDAVPNHSAWTATPVAVTTTPLPDTQAPGIPANLAASGLTASQVTLAWSASTDNVGVTGYRVYRDGTLVASPAGTSVAVTGLSAATTYAFTASAVDAASNTSAQSAPLPVLTSAAAPAPDTTAPSVPSGLVGTAVSSSQINLSWNASTDNVGVTGYVVYLGNVRLADTTTTSFTHSGLTAGTTYNYRVSAFDAVPNHSAWTATPVAVTTTGLPGGGSTPDFFCTFANSPTDCGFQVQQKAPGRASIVNVARDGSTGLRLHTEPGDNNVAGSGEMERTDVWLTQAASDGYEGREAWWSISVRFPDDFVFPTWHRYALSGFHHTGPTGQGNFTLGFERGANDSDPGILGFQGYGGVQNQLWAEGKIQLPGIPLRNVWYDFVYHVRWSSGSDGFFDAWVNGVKKLSHRGPTLYAGQGAYLKLANYHNPLCDPYPGCIGSTNPPSSVIYDRVIRGSTALSVSSGPLEGVLTLVNGVLTPLQ